MGLEQFKKYLQENKFSGEWRYIDEPENVFSGTLTYDPLKGGFLEFIGGPKNLLTSKETLASFLGKSPTGKFISIFNARREKTSFTFGVFSQHQYSFYEYWESDSNEGLHKSDILLESLRFQLSHLEEWEGRICLTPKFDSSAKRISGVSYSEFPSVNLYEDEKVSITLNYALSVQGNMLEAFHLYHNVFIKVSVKEGRLPYYNTEDQNNIEYYFLTMHALFSFLIGKDVFPYDITCRYETIKPSENASEHEKALGEQAICGKYFPYWEYEAFSGKVLSGIQMFLPRADIPDLPSLTAKWFSKQNIISDSVSQLTSFHNQKFISETTLAFLIFSFEGLHRKLYSKKPIFLKRLRNFMLKLQGKVPEKNTRDITLKERVFYSLFKCRKLLQLNNAQDLLIIAHKMTQHRDAIGHRDKDIELSGAESAYLSYEMSYLLEAMISKELDIPKETIKKGFERSMMFDSCNSFIRGAISKGRFHL